MRRQLEIMLRQFCALSMLIDSVVAYIQTLFLAQIDNGIQLRDGHLIMRHDEMR